MSKRIDRSRSSLWDELSTGTQRLIRIAKRALLAQTFVHRLATLRESCSCCELQLSHNSVPATQVI